MEKRYPNKRINGDTFPDQIKDSISAEIRVAYAGFSQVGDDVVIHLSESLSPGALIDLDDLIAAHDPDKERPYYLLYDLLHDKERRNHFEPPFDLDFKTQLYSKLKKKTLKKIQGKPTAVEYYLNYENRLYTNIICRRDFVLHYDAAGFITRKQDVLRWYLSDGSISPEGKDIGKEYDPILDMEARIKEGKARRSSIVDGLQLPVLAGLLETYPGIEGETFPEKQGRMVLIGRAFLQEHSQVFQDFITHSSKEVVNIVWTADETWLDTPVPSWGGYTIRGFILNELNI